MIRRKLRTVVSAGVYTFCAYLDMKAKQNIKDAEDDLEGAKERAEITTMLTHSVRGRLDLDRTVADGKPEPEPDVH